MQDTKMNVAIDGGNFNFFKDCMWSLIVFSMASFYCQCSIYTYNIHVQFIKVVFHISIMGSYV